MAQGYENYSYTKLYNFGIHDLWLNRISRTIFRPIYAKDISMSWIVKLKKLFFYSIFNLPAVLYYLKLTIARYLAKARINNYSLSAGQAKDFISKVAGIDKISIHFYNHHLCHAASAYYFSPFNKEKAISFVLDGYGDDGFSSVYKFNGVNHELISQSPSHIIKVGKKQHLTSVGFIYSNFTEALGLMPNSDEGKVEALAAFSTERNLPLYDKLVRSTLISKDGISFDLDEIIYFYDINFLRKTICIIGKENFAQVVQSWLEDTNVTYLNLIYQEHPIDRLCLSGGVMANIILNLNIYERTPFNFMHVFPAIGDDGVAAGAAILNALDHGQNVSWLSTIMMPYFGPGISKASVFEELTKHRNLECVDLHDEWPQHAAQALVDKRVIAIVHGKMEFRPRALGNRSIVANAMDANSTSKINSTIKRRPHYQPFCPSILEEERLKLFDNSFKHKHMAIAFRMRPEYVEKLPCAVHVDGTARPQFVEEGDNPMFYKLLKSFKELTGFGVVINTSFYLHGRTIVGTAKDAITDFNDCGIDYLYIEGILIRHNNH